MRTVSSNQLRSRLQSFELLQRRIETERQKNQGLLPPHKWWRLNYYNYPYLVGTPTDRLATRFRDIFINTYDLTYAGKLSPSFKENDSLTQKFTHLMEEWNSRGGLPTDVVADARRPVLKYFEHGTPAGIEIFAKFKKPTSPFLVKYSKGEYLESMLSRGTLRICPASYYSDAAHIDSIRDSENIRQFFVPTFRERLRGETGIEYQDQFISFDDDDLAIPLHLPDYFLFSLCRSVYYRLPTDFGADAALVIRDPILFSQRVVSAFLAKHPDWKPLVGDVSYYDPYLDHKKLSDERTTPEMIKHFGYSYQREYRIAFRSGSKLTAELSPEMLSIGPMTDYAEIISL